MFDVENCNKACEFYTLMPVSNGGNGISHFVLPADRIFPTSCKQWVEATPHVVSLTKEKCWDQSEQIFASSVFWYSVMVVLRKLICWNIMFMRMEFICGVAMQMAQIVPCLGFLLY
jgi:hypothetical protein